MKTLTLKDGRTLAYEDCGDPNGQPILFQHGTGDSRLCKNPDETILKELKIRLITTDRPGVGGSTYKKNRTILEWADDIKQLADKLGIDKFIVAGHSGGCPHALAIAYKMTDRVIKIGLASPLVPFDEPGNKKLVKDRDLQIIFHLRHLKFLANEGSKVEIKMFKNNMKKFVDQCIKHYPEDKLVFANPQLEPMFEAEFKEAFNNDGLGMLADFWAFEDWGFKIEDVQQPTKLFYGDADTILSPKSADHYRKRMPNLVGATWIAGGHYGVYNSKRWRGFLSSLTT